MKVANDFFSPALFVTYRFISGTIVLLAVAMFWHLPLPPKKFRFWIILTGILQIAFCSVAMQACFQYLSAGLVAMLNYTMPIWVTLLARFFLNESLTAQKIIGVIISIVGISILMNADITGNIYAILLALSAAIVWAVSNIIMKWKLAGCDPIPMTTWQMVAGAVSLTVYTFLFDDFTNVQWTPLSIACVLYNGILASALAYFLWFHILSHMQASKASVSILGVPVVGVISGIICLNETLTLTMTIGMILILFGIVLVQKS